MPALDELAKDVFPHWGRWRRRLQHRSGSSCCTFGTVLHRGRSGTAHARSGEIVRTVLQAPQNFFGRDTLELCGGGENRPFNGRRIAARQHAWCELWADQKNRLVCQSGSSNLDGVPHCDQAAGRRKRVNSRLTCVRQTVPRWCQEPSLLGNGPQYPFTEEFAMPGTMKSNHTVFGVHCSGVRNDAR
jgi:hypothetical protein